MFFSAWLFVVRRRYMNHDASRKLDRENRDRATKKMEEIQAREPNRAWGDLQFVEDATEGLSNCRAVLKWTYVLAHYLDDDTPEKDLFCFLQQVSASACICDF